MYIYIYVYVMYIYIYTLILLPNNFNDNAAVDIGVAARMKRVVKS